MYRTAARPAPLDFPLPSANSTYNVDRRKDFAFPSSLPHTTCYYVEAPTRDGLRTPPTDDMAATYQHPPYGDVYSSGRNSEYHALEGSQGNYGGSYNTGASTQSRQYMTLPQPPPASASTLRKEVQGYEPNLSHLPPSPQPTQRSSYAAHEEPPRTKSSTDIIRPNLQIPKTISSDGGSLAEFAAQVRSERTRSLSPATN